MNMLEQLFAPAILCIGALGIPACATLYFRRVRLSRPPIGVFERNDLLTLFTSIIVMPLIYLAIPNLVLSVLTTLILLNLLHQCLHSLVPNLVAWLLTLVLIAANVLP